MIKTSIANRLAQMTKGSLALICVFFLLAAFGLAFLIYGALFDASIPFLSRAGPAEWIVYPLYPQDTPRRANFVNLSAKFSRDFEAERLPAEASLYIRAFKRFRVELNGTEVEIAGEHDGNWKSCSKLDISKYLKQGGNTISVEVFCDYGHPALWLYTDGLGDDIKTDTSWQVSVMNSPAVSAGPAQACVVGRLCLLGPEPLKAFSERIISVVLIFIFSSAVFWFFFRSSRRPAGSQSGTGRLSGLKLRYLLWFWIIVLVIVFINNITQVPFNVGFDADGHIEYIQYIFENKKVPLADEGWEMYQPPLFYILSAIVLWATRLFYNGMYSLYSLKLIPLLAGIGQICLVYFACRILYAKNLIAQAVAVSIAALMPMNIYLFHYISNELLCAFLTGLLLLLTMIFIRFEVLKVRHFCLLGLVFGLALITKLTAIVAFAAVFIVLFYKLVFEQKQRLSRVVLYFGAMLLVAFVICGGFYVRNQLHFGKVFVANWDQQATGFEWWQEPGYHTSRYFFRFGRVFVNPYYAGFYSLFDSLYSTFWGDGYRGGGGNICWNYGFMSMVYILAIPASVLFLLGLFRAFGRLANSDGKLWFLILGSVFLGFYSIVYMNLRIAYYSLAKSFFALFALMPICLIFAFGFDLVDGCLRRKKGIFLRALFFGWFGTLAVFLISTFWVQPVQNRRLWDLQSLAKQGRLELAIRHYTQMLKQNQNDETAHYYLAKACVLQGQDYTAAVEHYKRALELRPDWLEALSEFSQLLTAKPDADDSERDEAIRSARRCCELTGYRLAIPLLTLAEAYYAAGKTQEAITTAEKALEMADIAKQKELLERINNRLKNFRNSQGQSQQPAKFNH